MYGAVLQDSVTLYDDRSMQGRIVQTLPRNSKVRLTYPMQPTYKRRNVDAS